MLIKPCAQDIIPSRNSLSDWQSCIPKIRVVVYMMSYMYMYAGTWHAEKDRFASYMYTSFAWNAWQMFRDLFLLHVKGISKCWKEHKHYLLKNIYHYIVYTFLQLKWPSNHVWTWVCLREVWWHRISPIMTWSKPKTQLYTCTGRGNRLTKEYAIIYIPITIVIFLSNVMD